MYLDTDIVLALVKKDDWLKNYVNLSQLRPACTSVFTVVEARIVLEREYGRREALQVLPTVKKLGITIMSLDSDVIEKSQELLQRYPQLNIFDSIHAAYALVRNEILVSTDHIFSQIAGVQWKDPRRK
jgi:predicted nucleic acid-binding protein